MPQRESGTTRASMSHTIAFLNAPRIFATRCFAGLTMCDSIRKRSKACFIPFFEIDVELFMRTYIAPDREDREQLEPVGRSWGLRSCKENRKKAFAVFLAASQPPRPPNRLQLFTIFSIWSYIGAHK